MNIKVRQEETPCNILLHRLEWLDFLVFLYEFKDQGATEEIEDLLKDTIDIVRKKILHKPDQGTLELTKLQSLNLYIHIQDFIKNSGDAQKVVTEKICKLIRSYLNGGSDG